MLGAGHDLSSSFNGVVSLAAAHRLVELAYEVNEGQGYHSPRQRGNVFESNQTCG